MESGNTEERCSREVMGGQAFFSGPGRDLRARGISELEQDIADVCFHGAHADNQGIGDLAVRFPLCDECRHLSLALGQAAKRLLVEATRRKWATSRN